MIHIRIPLASKANEFLDGEIFVPNVAKGLVVFAHGSGSGRESPRNQYVANILNQNGFATLLVGLLTAEEQDSDVRTQKLMRKIPGLVLNKFYIRLLTERLIEITQYIKKNISEVQDLPICYFGSSTGAAAALEASVSYTLFGKISSIFSRGGRPDLTSKESLRNITSPVLLVVGDKDSKQMIDLNKKALKQLKIAKAKEVLLIPGAGHLFEEIGAIEKVCEIAVKWFCLHSNQK